MKYRVQIGDRLHDVVLDGATATIDGQVWPVQLTHRPGAPVHLLRVGDAVHRVVVRREAARGTWTLGVDGWTVRAEALDERQRAIRDLQQAAGPQGPAPLVAPMPGLIVRLHVAVGDEVSAGQGLVAMEAMKMENELKAAGPGRVKAIHVVPGQAVEKGTVLVELD
ncbi:MAG: biotin/lipoyl-binding protein [Gemmatimonadaceae bacterium]|nr:biotin/lipoyl-binding protein [Gemmatimonadaceae bacterium]